MANERLQRVMEAANVDVDAIVEATHVDPRTVERWLKGRVPHPRHRRALASLLNEHENFLWPNDMSEAKKVPAKTGEIVADYAQRADVPASLWWRMFSRSRRKIDLLGYAMVFLPELFPDLATLLREKSMAACKIRIALADPNCKNVEERDKEEQLGGILPDRVRTTLYHFRDILNCPGIEVHYHTTLLYNSIFRFDNEMFVTPHLYGLHGSKAPLVHLRRLGPQGIFAKFAAHFDAVWATTVPVEQSVRVKM